METRTVALTTRLIDGSKLLVASVTADTIAEAAEQGAWLADRIDPSGNIQD